MKHNMLISMFAIVAMAAYSCAKVETDQDTANTSKGKPNFVSLSLSADIKETKTSISGTTISFSPNDKINIFDDSDYVTLYDYFETLSGGSTAVFSGEVDESGTDFYALYPYNASAQASWDYDEKTTTTVLPVDQTSDFGASNINAGVVDGSGLTFYNVCSTLKITIPGALDNEIGSIQITFTDKKVTGNVIVNYSGSIPVLTIVDDASAKSYVTLSDDSGSLPAGTYYLNVAPVSGSNTPVRIYAIDKNADKVFTLDTFIAKPLTAGTIKNLGTLPEDMFVPVAAIHTYTLELGTTKAKWTSDTNSEDGQDKEWNDVTWNLKQNSSYCQIDGTQMHMGSGSSSCTSATLSTSDITGKIKRITINQSKCYSSASVSVKVGSTSFVCGEATSKAIGTSNDNITFTGEAEGTIVISWTNTSRAVYFGDIEVEYEYGTIDPVNVTYFVGDTRYNTRVATGTLLSTILPENPDCGVSGYVFKGWSESPVATTNTEPTYTSMTTVPNEGVVLYGVFAEKNVVPGDPEPATFATSFSSPSSGWTVNQSSGTSYWKIFSGNYIYSPTFDLSSINSIDVQMGTFGGSGYSLNIASNGGTSWKTTAPTNSSESTSYTITSTTSLTGSGYLVFTCPGATSSAGLRIKSITIKYSKPTEIITYSGYTTSPGA